MFQQCHSSCTGWALIHCFLPFQLVLILFKIWTTFFGTGGGPLDGMDNLLLSQSQNPHCRHVASFFLILIMPAVMNLAKALMMPFLEVG
jgi:hypothetical protein